MSSLHFIHYIYVFISWTTYFFTFIISCVITKCTNNRCRSMCAITNMSNAPPFYYRYMLPDYFSGLLLLVLNCLWLIVVSFISLVFVLFTFYVFFVAFDAASRQKKRGHKSVITPQKRSGWQRSFCGVTGVITLYGLKLAFLTVIELHYTTFYTTFTLDGTGLRLHYQP